jgi:cadmium resistance protein CadD (predicted permease)
VIVNEESTLSTFLAYLQQLQWTRLVLLRVLFLLVKKVFFSLACLKSTSHVAHILEKMDEIRIISVKWVDRVLLLLLVDDDDDDSGCPSVCL